MLTGGIMPQISTRPARPLQVYTWAERESCRNYEGYTRGKGGVTFHIGASRLSRKCESWLFTGVPWRHACERRRLVLIGIKLHVAVFNPAAACVLQPSVAAGKVTHLASIRVWKRGQRCTFSVWDNAPARVSSGPTWAQMLASQTGDALLWCLMIVTGHCLHTTKSRRLQTDFCNIWQLRRLPYKPPVHSFAKPLILSLQQGQIHSNKSISPGMLETSADSAVPQGDTMWSSGLWLFPGPFTVFLL